MLLIAGGADQVWPSSDFTAALTARRLEAGRQIDYLIGPEAGHLPRFPGEPPTEPSARLAGGEAPTADAALGAQAWPRVLACLGLR
ncbi:MAG: hypothetical protein ACRDID_19440 [Ktedonobacterales bacterium]